MDVIVDALSHLLTIENFIFVNIGVFIGILFGAIPGMSANLGVTVFLPFTFTLGTAPALLLLCGIFFGANFGGSISAILINTPGTPASIAQTFDGYALVKEGKIAKALNINTIFSCFGGLVGTIVLIVASFPVARFALSFGPPEMFALSFFGLSMMIGVSGGNILKGLFAGIAGFMISTIGLDPMFSVPRFTFGNVNLLSGVQFVVVLVGMFGVGEVLYQVSNRVKGEQTRKAEIKRVKGDSLLTKKEWKDCAVPTVISALISAVIGAIPGTGGDIASIICWQQAKNMSKDPDSYGKGNITGLCVTSCANNAVIGGAMTTMMTLGIPGDGVTAVLIGSLMMYGMQPGPQMFVEHADFVYNVMALMVVGYIMIMILGLASSKLATLILKVKQEVIWVIVVGFCVLGSYAVNNSMFDVIVMFFAGIIGFICKKADIPLGPFILALLLGPIAESNFRRSMALSMGDASIFFTRPITVVLLLLTAASLIVPVVREGMKRKKSQVPA